MTTDKNNSHSNYNANQNTFDKYDHYKQASVIQRNTDTTTVRTKVEEDIAFLRARIQLMESHPRPNRVVLETYEGMLSSRIAVLKWLLHGSDDIELAGTTSVRRA